MTDENIPGLVYFAVELALGMTLFSTTGYFSCVELLARLYFNRRIFFSVELLEFNLHSWFRLFFFFGAARHSWLSLDTHTPGVFGCGSFFAPRFTVTTHYQSHLVSPYKMPPLLGAQTGPLGSQFIYVY
jgi:hypothetical protein